VCTSPLSSSKRNHSPCSEHEHQSPLQNNDEAIMFENFDDHPNSSFEEHAADDDVNYGSVNDGVGLILAASLAEGNPNDSSNWQVVPESLDRLSRDELCRMICRLDYERNELRDLLQQQQQQFQQQQQQLMHRDNAEHWNQVMNAAKGDFPTTTTPLIRAVSDFIRNNRHRCEQTQQHHQQPNKKPSSRPSRKRKQQQKQQNESAQEGGRELQAPLEGDADDCIGNGSIADAIMCNSTSRSLSPLSPHTATVAATSTITPEEVSTLRSRLGQDLVNLIQTTALHGGRKIPKTTLVERGISLDLAREIIMKATTATTIDDVDPYSNNNNNDHTELMKVMDVPIISETKRQLRWKIDDDDSIIMHILGRDERLIHPVKHDGSGFYVFPISSSTEESISSSSSTSPSSAHSMVKNRANSILYHWARFVSLEVRYDKRDMTLVYIAKTVAAGIGRPERALK